MQYKSSRKNTNADALSRIERTQHHDSCESSDDTILAAIEPYIEDLEVVPQLNVIFEEELTTTTIDHLTPTIIMEEQRRCPDVAPIIEYLDNGKLPEEDSSARHIVMTANEYVLHDDILYYYFQPRSKNSSKSIISQLVVPSSLRDKILHGFHETSSHPGFHRCYLSITMKYFWPHIHIDVQNHIASCTLFQSCKYPVYAKKHSMQPLPIKEIFGRWHIDILVLPRSHEGFRYLLLCVESLTRFPEAFPLMDQQVETIAEVLYRQIISCCGAPKSLLSDRGSNFLSNIVAELSKTFGIKRLHTSGFGPQTNGAAERVNRHL